MTRLKFCNLPRKVTIHQKLQLKSGFVRETIYQNWRWLEQMIGSRVFIEPQNKELWWTRNLIKNSKRLPIRILIWATIGQRLMSRWIYQLSYDQWNQAFGALPVLRRRKPFGKWWVLLWSNRGVKPTWFLREAGNLALEADPGISPIQTKKTKKINKRYWGGFLHSFAVALSTALAQRPGSRSSTASASWASTSSTRRSTSSSGSGSTCSPSSPPATSSTGSPSYSCLSRGKKKVPSSEVFQVDSRNLSFSFLADPFCCWCGLVCSGPVTSRPSGVCCPCATWGTGGSFTSWGGTQTRTFSGLDALGLDWLNDYIWWNNP